MNSYLKSAVLGLVIAGVGAASASAATMKPMDHMKKKPVAAAAAVVAPVSVTGSISHLSLKRHWVEIGKVAYFFGPKVHTKGLKKGEKVDALYQVSKGKRWITEISPAKA